MKQVRFPNRPTRRGASELGFWNLFHPVYESGDPRIARMLYVLDIIDVKAAPLLSFDALLVVVATMLLEGQTTGVLVGGSD